MPELNYNISDKPPTKTLFIASLQQLLAIISATIAVPNIIGYDMSPSMALFGAGLGTIIYLMCTQFKSPVFLGSSFAFISVMKLAFDLAPDIQTGNVGLIIGGICAGIVYAILALSVKKFGTDWILNLMPPVIIGPTVMIIGLTLAGNAVTDITSNGEEGIICALLSLLTIIACISIPNKTLNLFPFVIGFIPGYCLAELLGIIDLTNFTITWTLPKFTFLNTSFSNITLDYIISVCSAYSPIALVVFAEHVADHLNLSSIIGKNLLVDPGLHRTLLGDGLGTIVGSFFGGCPNTTYGESIGVTAITKNASTRVIFTTAILSILLSLFPPFSAFLSTIPLCIIGACEMCLYGMIAASGLKMLKSVDLTDTKNTIIISIMLVLGLGNFTITLGNIVITNTVCALICGLLVKYVSNYFSGDVKNNG